MADSDNLITVTDDSFTDQVEASKGLVIIDFWAVWCGPCRLIAPIMKDLADEYQGRGVTVGKLDVDHNPRVAARFGVRSIPSILFFKDGTHVDTVVGAVPKPFLERKIQEHMPDVNAEIGA
jgi:thioredoxin 1